MPETLADPSSALGRGVLTLLGLREESQQ
jgi:hypothetical protein